MGGQIACLAETRRATAAKMATWLDAPRPGSTRQRGDACQGAVWAGGALCRPGRPSRRRRGWRHANGELAFLWTTRGTVSSAVPDDSAVRGTGAVRAERGRRRTSPHWAPRTTCTWLGAPALPIMARKSQVKKPLKVRTQNFYQSPARDPPALIRLSPRLLSVNYSLFHGGRVSWGG